MFTSFKGGGGGGASLVLFPHLTQCSLVSREGGGGASLVLFPHLTQCSLVSRGGGITSLVPTPHTVSSFKGEGGHH